MFDWTDARIFLVVCARKSFTAAAKDLGIDQTTVGRRIAALEAALKTKLFRRSPLGLSLTSAGEEARSLAEQMEGIANTLDRRVRGRDRTPEGTVQITTIESLARGFVAPRLAAFRALHPLIQIRLKSDNRALSLERREADVAIRHWKPTQPGLVVRKIGQVAFALYASPSYRSAEYAYIGFDDELASMPDAEWLDQKSAGRYVLRSNSRAVVESAAAGGVGVALLPCYLGDRNPGLVRIEPQETALTRDLWLVVHAELVKQAAIRAVTEFFVREAAKAKNLLLGRAARTTPHHRVTKSAP